MQHLRVVALAVLSGAVLMVQAQAAPFVFTTPDFALPLQLGTGLSGQLWVDGGHAGVLSEVDTLAQARFIADNFAPDATFTSTQIDYPNGPQETAIIPGTDFATVLGVDAGSLLPASVASHEINNSVMLLNGYFRVDADHESHSFTLGSDDGSRLTVQGTTVIDNDRIHAVPGDNSGPVEVIFATPGLYNITIFFFESQPVGYGITVADNGAVVPTGKLYPVISQPIPEPGSTALLGAALAGLAIAAIMRRRNKDVQRS